MSAPSSHHKKPLTAIAVKQLSKPGRYGDGNGLYLVVDSSGARRWVLRIVVHGRRRDIGLGSARLVPLADARTMAITMRRLARDGGDPLAERRKQRKQRKIAPSFKVAAETVHAEAAGSWKNKRHSDGWLSSLAAYAFPVIGNRPVDQIATADVLKVLQPIWLSKPETARRVRQRIRTVLDWARVTYAFSGGNPVDGVEKALPKQGGSAEHFAAMPYTDVPAFMAELRRRSPGEMTRLAFEFLVLTACRTNEVLLASWHEINLAEATWTIPKERMKGGETHVVPLVPRTLALLAEAKALGGDQGLVFPSQRPEKPLSNMVFLMTLRRMELVVTAHGFRSSFRDWAAEETHFPEFVVEKALAHAIKSDVEAAYRRGDLLKKRRALMSAWTAYCEGEAAKPSARQQTLTPKLHLTEGLRDDDDVTVSAGS